MIHRAELAVADEDILLSGLHLKSGASLFKLLENAALIIKSRKRVSL